MTNRHFPLALLAAIAAVATPVRAADSPDALLRAGNVPAALGAPSGSPARLIADALTGADPASDAALATWLRAAAKDHPLCVVGFKALATRAHVESRFADAAAADAAALECAGDVDRESFTQQLALEKAGSAAPATRSIGRGGARFKTVRDAAGKLNIPVEFLDKAGKKVTGATLITDTGAEISVLSASMARRAGATILSGAVPVGTPTGDIEGRLALVPRIDLGGMVFTDVVFLMLPDGMLTFNGGAYVIDGIIGLPTFRAAGRIGWRDGGATLLLGDAVPALDANDAPIYWHDSGIGLSAMIDGHPGTGFFDSGASFTLFRPTLEAALPAEVRATIEDRTRTAGSIGGNIEVKSRRVPSLSLKVAGQPLAFKNAVIEPDEEAPSSDVAAFGLDVVGQVTELDFDLGKMRMRIVP